SALPKPTSEVPSDNIASRLEQTWRCHIRMTGAKERPPVLLSLSKESFGFVIPPQFEQHQSNS
ncbi:MAG: hypothetical protein JXQ75_18475, partial [Phycisphaerae bacterium]|nr:hypothetical protein [Phycisphaerae bacterium]